jgi:hypothetical protein
MVTEGVWIVLMLRVTNSAEPAVMCPLACSLSRDGADKCNLRAKGVRGQVAERILNKG